MRSVRFTPRGSEKRALGNFMSVRVHRAMEREYRNLSGIDVDVGGSNMAGMDMRELEIR